jgi:hypothetical protein
MDQDIKKRWVDALRSGEYKQARNYLSAGDGYCCLGVLCEIAVQDGVVFKDDDTYFSKENPHNDYSAEELPDAVRTWAGLDEIDHSGNPLSDVPYTGLGDWPVRRPPGRENAHLSELNDDMDYDFNMIADVIERTL